MILNQIQQRLQQLYQIEVEQQVEDFVVTSFSQKVSVGDRRAREALLIRQRGETTEIGLFILPAILAQLQRNNPFHHLTRQNLEAFCVAVEGVSHFLYYLKKNDQEMPVTKLELELQAEIDKYLLASLLFLEQEGSVPDFLFSLLFENIGWDPALQKEERQRYLEANRLARKFCAYLDQNFLRYRRWTKALAQARDFYSLDHWTKIAQLTP